LQLRGTIVPGIPQRFEALPKKVLAGKRPVLAQNYAACVTVIGFGEFSALLTTGRSSSE
jgi:hypothetical protein